MFTLGLDKGQCSAALLSMSSLNAFRPTKIRRDEMRGHVKGHFKACDDAIAVGSIQHKTHYNVYSHPCNYFLLELTDQNMREQI